MNTADTLFSPQKINVPPDVPHTKRHLFAMPQRYLFSFLLCCRLWDCIIIIEETILFDTRTAHAFCSNFGCCSIFNIRISQWYPALLVYDATAFDFLLHSTYKLPQPHEGARLSSIIFPITATYRSLCLKPQLPNDFSISVHSTDLMSVHHTLHGCLVERRRDLSIVM